MLQPSAHLRTECDARLLEDSLTTMKDDEIRDGLNAESRCQMRVSFGVDLKDQSPASHLAGQLLNFGCRHSAWPAPRGPKVNQNRHFGSRNDFVK
jgi:hypothetical protein